MTAPRDQYDQPFEPDWARIWSAEEAEMELTAGGQRFKFSGPGWYFTGTDTVLVTTTTRPGRYQFNVYNGRNPCEAFNWIANAPVRVDER